MSSAQKNLHCCKDFTNQINPFSFQGNAFATKSCLDTTHTKRFIFKTVLLSTWKSLKRMQLMRIQFLLIRFPQSSHALVHPSFFWPGSVFGTFSYRAIQSYVARTSKTIHSWDFPICILSLRFCFLAFTPYRFYAFKAV